MIIWLINPYGPIPGENWRDYRFTVMADTLSNAGHKVVWWTSNFSHHFKNFRSTGWCDVQVHERFVVRLVPTPGYSRNVGIGRIIRDIVFATRAYFRGKELPPPDCIVYSESPLTLGFAGQRLGKHHRRPVVFDQMDLWPEIFERVLPRFARPMARCLLAPIYRIRKSVYGKLDAVIALANAYLEVPLREAPILRSRPNMVIYNGIDVQGFRSSMQYVPQLNGPFPIKQAGDVWAVFAGSLGDSYDIPVLLKGAAMMEASAPNVRIIIAGDGPLRSRVEGLSTEKNRSQLTYVGQLTPEKLAKLYSLCDIGLCTYSKRSNVEMPDKFFDYTAAGLPIINSLLGEVSSIIREKRIGLQYQAGDAADFISAIKRLAIDHSLRKEMANNSFETGITYDRRNQYAPFVNLVEKICEKRSFQ